MGRADLRPTLLLAALSAAALLCGAAGLVDPGTLFYAVPALVLVAPLLVGRYPGEEAIARRVAAARPRARCGAVQLGIRARGAASVFPRGGLLMATGLAVRPPPVAS
jgi:hypothetical protein